MQACGATGLVTVFQAARKAGARGAQVLAYAASGDVTGDKSPGSYTLDHTAASFVFDPSGRLRLFVRYGSGAVALADDVRVLLKGAA